MNLSQCTDLVLAYLTQYGAGQIMRIPRTIVQNVINAEMVLHFEFLKNQHAYWHTTVQQGLEEYNLPDGVIAVDMVKIANERYYPAPWPYVEDAKRTGTGRTRVTEDGQTVDAVADRWYWKRGEKLSVYPEPAESTGADVTGTCTVAGSVVTVVTGALGSVNSKKRRLVLVGDNLFIILVNSGTTFTVDGTPAAAATTYIIYAQGLEVWGVERPPTLTVGSSDNIPGTEVDANAIAAKVAYVVGLTLPGKREVDFGGLVQVYQEYRRQSKEGVKNIHYAPLSLTPHTLRRDHAGYK